MKKVFILLIIILGIAVYSNSLNGKFIWDDRHLVKDNIYIKNWSNVSKIFTENVRGGGGRKYGFYRPLQILTYSIDYSLWRLDVRGYHVINTLLHILVALSIYWLINILYDDKLFSILTSLFFVAHPIHTQAVSYISGRADPLVALFMLLCFIFYIKYLKLQRTHLYFFMLLSYILALLSRENSLILPVLLLLYHYTFKKKLKVKEFLPILSITFIYILLRFTFLKPFPSDIPYRTLFDTTLFQRIPGFFVAITNYTRLLFLPLGLHMSYESKLFNFIEPPALLGILILSALLIYAFKKRKTDRLIFFAISWFFIALLPQSNIYPLALYMAEHWLYLPSIGFFLILAKFLSHMYKVKNLKALAIVFIIGLLSFYSYLTVKQNNYWKEPITFYETTLKHAPDDPRLYNNLGVLYRDIGKTKEAIGLFKKAIEINAYYAGAYYNLGRIYQDTGKTKEAISLYKKTVEIDPYFAEGHNNLALAYYHEKKYNLAIEHCDKAVRLGYKVHSSFLKQLEPYRK